MADALTQPDALKAALTDLAERDAHFVLCHSEESAAAANAKSKAALTGGQEGNGHVQGACGPMAEALRLARRGAAAQRACRRDRGLARLRGFGYG